MEIHQHIEGSLARLELVGRFTYEGHREFKSVVSEILEAKEVSQIILGMVGLTYLDSSALGMLLLMRERALISGVQLHFEEPNRAVQKILKAANFDRIFEIRERP